MSYRSLEIKVYTELLTGHVFCDIDTAHEFLDWVEQNDILLWEPGSVNYFGDFRRWDVEKRRKSLQGRTTATTFWFLGPPDAAFLLKLRWNDHFLND